MRLHRRNWLFGMGAAAAGCFLVKDAAAKLAPLTAKTPANISPVELAQDEDFWFQVRQCFVTDRSLINLNSGGCCQPANNVMEALQRREDFVTLAPFHNMWRVLNANHQCVKRRLARIGNVNPDQLAIVRNTTEAMCIVIYGRDFKEGDEVIACNMEFPGMLNALNSVSLRRGIKLKVFDVPLAPDDPEVLVKAYMDAITPKTKMLLLSHMVFTNGQIFPVKEICRQARERGVLTLIDGAHSYAQIFPLIGDIGCDFFGASLHKWLGAPAGTGLLWMRKELISSTWPLFDAKDPKSDQISKFEHFGTFPVPTFMSIGEACAFHETLGAERKAARLHTLKKYWTYRIQELGAELVTNPAPEHSCALAAFTLKGYTGKEIYQHLFEKHRIITTGFDVPHHGFLGVRVSPNIYNSLEELDMLIEAVKAMPRK